MPATQNFTNPPDTAHVLQRYRVAQPHRLIYNYEELKELGVQPEFLMNLLAVFEDTSSFNPENFRQYPLPVIIDYLEKTHAYYLQKKLPEIEQNIHLLLQAYPQAHPLLLLLHSFYKEYSAHLARHIEVEEHELIPYILSLHNQQPLQPTLTVSRFMKEHHDTEKDLEDIRQTILHYSPPAGSETIYRVLLSQLELLERDLAVHALMEDEVLLPRALALEQSSGR